SQSRVRPRIFTCCGNKPISSCSSRYIACSGVSPYLMPPCGNCHECSRIRLPHQTSLWWLSRIMPTFGRKPSRSSINHLDTFCGRSALSLGHTCLLIHFDGHDRQVVGCRRLSPCNRAHQPANPLKLSRL